MHIQELLRTGFEIYWPSWSGETGDSENAEHNYISGFTSLVTKGLISFLTTDSLK